LLQAQDFFVFPQKHGNKAPQKAGHGRHSPFAASMFAGSPEQCISTQWSLRAALGGIGQRHLFLN
jgi:hypothetical protein